VLGLLFHAAEHAQRHCGQATTTARIVRGRSDEGVQEAGQATDARSGEGRGRRSE
jgi:hypothetical protein